MKRFFHSNIATCLISGSIVFAVAMIPILFFHFLGFTLVSGIIILVTSVFLYSNSHARSGINAMQVQLSQYTTLKAVCISVITFIFLLGIFTVLVTVAAIYDFDASLARLVSTCALLAYFPASVLIVLSPFQK